MLLTAPMAQCRSCSAEIFFAWDKRVGWEKWVPVDMVCVRGDEEEYQGGVVRMPHHARHMCGLVSAAPGAPAPCRVLFVAADAPQEVVRAAYHALAKYHHPDSGGSVEAMAELNTAYESLMATAPSLVK